MRRRRHAPLAAGAGALLLAGSALPGMEAPARGEGLRVAEARSVTVGEDAVPLGPSVEARLAEIQSRVARAVVYPPVARRRGWEGVARVRFAVERDGRAVDVRVARSSGHPALDRAAERGVDAAAPLPWVYGRVEVPVRFDLEGEG